MTKRSDLNDLTERVTNLERAFRMLADELSGRPKMEKGEKKSAELQIHEAVQRIEDWASHHEMQQTKTIEVIAALTKQLEESGSNVTQIVPVTVFLDTRWPSDVTEVAAAIDTFLSSLDLDLFFQSSGEWGSWFGRSFARSKRALTSQGVKDTLTRAERALEIQTLHIPQAQIDAMQADAASKLIAALDSTHNALVQIGSVLLVKVDGVPIVRNLTQVELSYLEHNKHLYKSPSEALEALGRVSGDAARFTLATPEERTSMSDTGIEGQS